MKKIIIVVCIILFNINGNCQVGIGTTSPNSSSQLDITSTTSGLLIPRMTQAQKTAIVTPTTGLLIYQTDGSIGYWFYNGAAWTQFSSGSAWGLNGNAGTTIGTNKLGTNDNQPLVIKTNNSEIARIGTNGYLGIGTNSPLTSLHLNNASGGFSDGFEDNTLAPFTTGGDANWGIQSAVKQSGTYAASSGTIGNSNTTYMEYTHTFPNSGSISFYYNTSTETNYDKLNFSIDGVIQTTWSGIIGWTLVTYPVSAGTHTFKWDYTKDSSGTGGSDIVYIDNITIISPTPLITIQDGNQNNGFVLVSNANGDATWTNPSAFVANDDDWRFASGSTINDPIYRTGRVQIGNSVTPINLLEVEESTASTKGTQIGIGNDEYLQDLSSIQMFSHNVVPRTDNSISLGNATLKWNKICAMNGTINTSDIRDKENIKPLFYGTKQLMKLNPVSYQWKTEKYGNTVVSEEDKLLKIGFLAQDVLKILPEVVQTESWEFNNSKYTKIKNQNLGVNYAEILPVVVKTIQEQDELMKVISKKQIEIENKLKELKN